MRALPSSLLLFLVGCGTLHGARPLHPGQHEVGLTLGGPMIELGGPLPLPNAVLGARSGLGHIAGKPLDLGYGTNLTGLPFGIVSLYGDLGWLALEQEGAAPAVAIRNKLFWSHNFLASKRDDVPKEPWAVDEIDMILSWKLDEHVFHGTIGQVFDFTNPQLNLVAGIGAALDFGRPGGLVLQPEVRWWGLNHVSRERNVQWVPGRPGAIGVHLGFAYRFGRGMGKK